MQLTNASRLQFVPGATAIVRGPHHLQFGLDATRSGIIEAADPERLAVVFRTLHSPTRLERFTALALRECGMDPEDTVNLVADLLSYRVLTTTAPAPALVLGRSPLATALRALLSPAGIQLRSPIPRETPEKFISQADPASAVIAVDQLTTARPLAHATSAHPGPVLAVSLIDARVHIGPLRLRRGDPCLYCTDLYHRDRDPHWSHVAAALHDASPTPDPLVVAAGATCAARLIRRLCGAPDPPGVSAPEPARGTRIIADPFGPTPVTQDVLPPHPDCPLCY